MKTVEDCCVPWYANASESANGVGTGVGVGVGVTCVTGVVGALLLPPPPPPPHAASIVASDAHPSRCNFEVTISCVLPLNFGNGIRTGGQKADRWFSS